MNYIDQLYEEMMARQSARSPAMFTDPNSVLKPLGAEMPREVIKNTLTPKIDMSSPGAAPENPQKQPYTSIEATKIEKPIGPVMPTFEDPELRKPEYVERFRENINPVYRQQAADYADLEQEKAKRDLDYQLSRQALLSAAKAAAESPEPFKSQYDYDKRIQELQNLGDLQPSVEQPKQENMAVELIKMLGAPLLGAVTGESGQIAQLQAQKNIQAQAEKQKELEMKRQQSQALSKSRLANEISQRMVGLRQLKEGEYGIYEKENKFKQDQLNKLADRLQHMSDKDFEGLKNVQSDLQKLGADLSKGVTTGSEKMAGFEEKELRAKEKVDQEAARLAFEKEKLKKQEAGKNLRAAKTAASLKKIPTSAAENIANAHTAISALEDAKALTENNPEMFGKGPGIVGTLSEMTGIGDTATKAASLDSDLMSKAQRIGVFLEGGKLAEGDIKRYSKMLPQRGDKPIIVQNKIAALERLLQNKLNNDLKSYEAAGYDVSQFQKVPVSKGLTKGIETRNVGEIIEKAGRKFRLKSNGKYEEVK